MKKWIVVFIMWVSWAGKNTVLHLLKERNPTFQDVLSYKTRPLRPGEVDGVNYHYLTNEQFRNEIDKWSFLEYAELYGYGHLYWTKKSDIVDGINAGKVLLKEMDLQGMRSIAMHHKDIYEDALRIFITLSDEVMIRRITTRAPISDEELHKRLITAAGEREQAKIYASHIVNWEGTVEEVYQLVANIVHDYLAKKQA